ncbi:protein patched [Cimex lectularius]|uniref:SSD domain-containing protein n=1 Tax=Cimex lectularius TaxID=79782 RepID=A0A8I6REA7_CIMLE|nr:protein patched [Cimex lectularius]
MLADKTSDVYIRTAWANAEVALAQINKGKAEGSRTAIWVRSRIQAELFHLGCLVYCHPGKVIFVAILLLASFCVGLKSAVFHSRIEQLWVEEGGNVEKELRYRTATLGETGSSIHQLVIQTAKDSDASVLHPYSLLKHAEVVKIAISLSVNLFDITWRLKDLCYSPSITNFDAHFIDQIFENIIPCAIITPLDCFWEGSKLLGPDYPVNIPGLGSKVYWTNLNPQKLLETAKTFEIGFPYDTLEQHMKRAGISTGYQEKPCLNPLDEECPSSASNKKSQKPPNIGAELTGGCYGFAAKYMHWPEELILGGIKRNKTGHIQKAQALQTVVQLMGEKELHEFWSDTYKVHYVDWSQEKAALVLETWQKSFSKEIHRLMGKGNSTSPYNMYAFSSATLNDILHRFSQININKIAFGYVLMLLYAAASLLRWNDPVRSQCALGVAGVILVSVTVAAGLGFCAVLGIAFNASTTEIVPFLALGLGVDDMFLLTHTYAEQAGNNTPPEEQTGFLLKKTGLSVLLTSLSNMCAMFAAALIPIPALRVFSLQSAVLVLFNLASALLVFPAIVSLDLRRRGSGRYDMLCCCLPPQNYAGTCTQKTKGPACKQQAITRALPPDRQQTVTMLAPKKTCKVSSQNEEKPNKTESNGEICELLFDGNLSLSTIGSCYSKFIMKPQIKIISTILFIVVLIISVWGLLRITDGLDLKDIVPQDTNEHEFLNAQTKYFGFYNMYAVSHRDFEYPTNQKLLYEYHEAFMRVESIVKNDNGGLPPFWLSMFRDWLIELQLAFDRDWKNGKITQERWYSNASDEGILAYKLLVQTGHVDNPIDKSLITQVKLVDSEGIINPKAFYNYLSAWATNDALAYGASAANLYPNPREWHHVATDFDLKIPKSAPLKYTQLPFYLHGLKDTAAITKAVTQVREICQKFEERGVPNFPSGIPFLFWEQYIHLRQSLGLALLCALTSVFIVISVLLVNPWTAALIVFMLAGMILQLLGIMGALGIKLSAIPAVLLIIAVGLGVHFTVHLCLSFVTSIGNRERRSIMAVKHMFSPIVHGALTMLLAIVMLAFSEFDFIVRYFFYILLASVGVGLINGLVFLPTLLSLIGPEAEVRPFTHENRISTPSPEPLRKVRPVSYRNSAAPPRRATSGGQCHREPSLTTITEEASWHSTTHEIIVEPEFVVETTTCTHPHNGNGGSNKSSCGQHSWSQHSDPQPQSTPHITTKVTATAKLKVEVHTPIGTVDSCKTRRSRRTSKDSSSSSDSDIGNRI